MFRIQQHGLDCHISQFHEFVSPYITDILQWLTHLIDNFFLFIDTTNALTFTHKQYTLK